MHLPKFLSFLLFLIIATPALADVTVNCMLLDSRVEPISEGWIPMPIEFNKREGFSKLEDGKQPVPGTRFSSMVVNHNDKYSINMYIEHSEKKESDVLPVVKDTVMIDATLREKKDCGRMQYQFPKAEKSADIDVIYFSCCLEEQKN